MTIKGTAVEAVGHWKRGPRGRSIEIIEVKADETFGGADIHDLKERPLRLLLRKRQRTCCRGLYGRKNTTRRIAAARLHEAGEKKVKLAEIYPQHDDIAAHQLGCRIDYRLREAGAAARPDRTSRERSKHWLARSQPIAVKQARSATLGPQTFDYEDVEETYRSARAYVARAVNKGVQV